MIIIKNEKTYSVCELKSGWKLSANIGGVAVDYNVPKDICPTLSDLEQYVIKSNLF